MEFAQKIHAEIEKEDYFFVQLRYDQLQEAKRSNSITLDHTQTTIHKEKKFGTVGCVAFDQDGNLAAGTSTGGMTNKKF